MTKKYSSTKKLIALFLALACLIIILPLVGYLSLVLGFSGGIDGVLSSLKTAPDPKSPGVSAKRNAIQSDINHAFSSLEIAAGLKEYAKATYDYCYEGQNNWKIKDGYAHRCDYRLTKYYGFNGDFRQRMLDLEQKLLEQQWQPTNGVSGRLSFYIKNYYDEYYGSKNSEGSTYVVSSMPTVINGYTKNNIRMDVAYGEKASQGTAWLESTQSGIGRGTPIYEDTHFIDLRALFAEITEDNKYIVAISLDKNYFEN